MRLSAITNNLAIRPRISAALLSILLILAEGCIVKKVAKKAIQSPARILLLDEPIDQMPVPQSAENEPESDF